MAQERLSKIAGFYNSEAVEYDDGYSSLVCKAEDAFVTEVLKPIMKGSVLDIGAGCGLFCEMFDVEEYQGIELSSLMTRKAKDKFDKSFMVGDMHRIPFADNSFDTAVSLYGPPSYSLVPEELMEEVTRVVRPGGYVALMPYTLRVGHHLDIGGYSTATEKRIEKIFYTEELARELMRNLQDVRVIGVNYFLNTEIRFAQEMGINNQLTLEQMVDFFRLEQSFVGKVKPEQARHMITIGRKRS